MEYLNRNSAPMTIASFYELHQLGKVDYNPKCQRNSIWGIEEKSFLMDTILKNFPIPPIFLHQGINTDTGNTRFSVIDGKQRLLAIIGFINGEVCLPENFGEGIFGDEKLNGLTFNDLKDEHELVEYRKLFWRYQLPIEYVDTEEEKVVDNIFDRLNRNGIPLKEQELRKAQYHSEILYGFIQKLTNIQFWNDILCKMVNVERMLDVEFISELLFMQLEGDVLDADPKSIDFMYHKYTPIFNEYTDGELQQIEDAFIETTNILVNLNIDFNKYKIEKVSHLYGLWAFANYCYTNHLDSKQLSEKLNLFYQYCRQKDSTDENVIMYKKSMSSNTKSKNQRKKRLEALSKFTES